MRLHRVPENKIAPLYQLVGTLEHLVRDEYEGGLLDMDDSELVVKVLTDVQDLACQCVSLLAVVLFYEGMYDNKLFDLNVDYVRFDLMAFVQMLDVGERESLLDCLANVETCSE